MAKKLVDLFFLVAILIVLTAGLVTALFFPEEINTYENRYADRIAPFTVTGYLDGSFQDSMDAGLSDQVNFSSWYKKLYNYARTASLRLLASPVARAHPDRYFYFQGLRLFGGDWLTYWTRPLESLAEALDAKAENCNETFARLPGTEFYVYFVEKDTDIDFETGEKNRSYEYLRDRLTLAPDRVSRFQLDSFEQFSQYFYRTDHHWNHRGSYQGYLGVLELLGIGDTPLVPMEEVAVPGRFSGSKASDAGAAGFWESVSMYRFDFPAMEVQINGLPSEGYGNQELFWSGRGWAPSYGDIYGGDMGEIVFSGGRPGGGNILVLGESYDNAVLRLLASHFDNLYSVDLRYYSAYMGEDFRLSEYLEEHGIDKVLLIGNIDYFIMDEFRLEG